MGVNPESLETWFNSLAVEALDKNSRAVATWDKYKNDLTEAKNILTWLPQKLKHSVMVPIGPKALMRGKIVHTNEVLVNLGETWFAKRSASQAMGICDRRIKKCDEVLDKLAKERELLENKKSLPTEREAFGSDDHPEIIEYVTEEEEHEWRKRHRLKEKEYRQKLAEMRDTEKKQIVTEEDLWNRLDELELREELEDELNRLHADDEDGDESEDDMGNGTDPSLQYPPGKGIKEPHERGHGQDGEANVLNRSENFSQINSGKMDLKGDNKRSKKHRVSFSFDVDDCQDSKPLKLEIKHSPNEPCLSNASFSGVINSPADIYNVYIKSIIPQSILKKPVNVKLEKEPSTVGEDESTDLDYTIVPGIVLHDVVARDPQEVQEMQTNEDGKIETTRRISKFKASRMKKS